MRDHVVVVDHHQPFLEFLTFCLSKQGYKVTPLNDGQGVLRVLKRERPDVVLLDRILPDMGGHELCRRIKIHYPNVPVLMLALAGEASDIVGGLDTGADDYLPKPFPPETLLAKIRAVNRRRLKQVPETKPSLCRGPLAIDEGNHKVTLETRALDLTKTEYRILLYLAKRDGLVVERKELAANIPGFSACGAGLVTNLASHISSLRKKLGRYRTTIETQRGVGYRFRKPQARA